MATRILGLPPDVAGGAILGLGAVAGLLAKNIDLVAPWFEGLMAVRIAAGIGPVLIDKPLHLWINDGLMAIFFLVVGLEIKRELVRGALSSLDRAVLPVLAAAGGMAAPALIFLGIVGVQTAETRGWAIPAATDIAFAVGVLSIFRSRIPPALRTFLLAVAIVDDLGAIIIIAAFYTASLNLGALWAALAVAGLLLALSLLGVRRTPVYVLLGIAMWTALLKSGVHATLAGVALGFLVPLREGRDGRSLAETWEHGLMPWSAFLIMPVFAFANAGVDLSGLSVAAIAEPVPLGIALGLFVGKQIGVFGTVVVASRLGIAARPEGVTVQSLYGVSLLAGIGFTMSLFIGSLAYADPVLQNHVKLGVLTGSIVSGLVGAVVLMLLPRTVPAALRPAAAH